MREFTRVVALILLGMALFTGPSNCATYRAAVYQMAYTPADDGKPPMETMLSHVEVFEGQIRTAAVTGADIIVFPEYGITGPDVPLSRNGIKPYTQAVPKRVPEEPPWNPCLETQVQDNITVLHRLSCAARSNGIVVVANLPSIQTCNRTSPPCPEDDVLQYNTDVVFSEDGALIARYDKYHLYGEAAYDQPPLELVTFTTAFNVTFGILTCFDLVWEEPLALLVQQGVYNIVFPTAWIDGLPFLTAVQAQESRAIGYRANLLAADIPGYPGAFTGGGIYEGGKGAVRYLYGNLTENVLLIDDLRATPLPEEAILCDASTGANAISTYECDRHFVREGYIIYDSLTNYTLSQAIGTENGSLRVCHPGGHCCQLDFEGAEEHSSGGAYYGAAYAGPITLGGGMYHLEVEVCSVMWCKNSDPNTCSRLPVSAKKSFETFKLKGNFTTPYLFPSVLRSDLQLSNSSFWSFEKSTLPDDDNSKYTAEIHSLPDFCDTILVASIYGNKY